MQRCATLFDRSPRQDDGSYLMVSARRPATTLFETWLIAELSDAGVARKAPVVRRLTERWLREELGQGAATVDVGLWGPERVRREVESVLRELEGDFVRTIPSGAAGPADAATPLAR